MTDNIRIIDIVPGTSVDGPGLRTSIYLAGCRHQCPGCHNPQSWDFNAGKKMSTDDIITEIDRHGFNVTLTGGDPIYRWKELLPLVEWLHGRGYTIWCYTGFLYEEICEKMPGIDRFLQFVEVLVDGPFIEALRDTTLLFKGSSNQRLIDIKRSSPSKVSLWRSHF